MLPNNEQDISLLSFSFSEGEFEGIEGDDFYAWAKAYPACDVKAELLKMAEWIKANPAKGKKSNYRRFITNWLSRQQDRGGSKGIIPLQAPDRQPVRSSEEKAMEGKIAAYSKEIWDKITPKIEVAQKARDAKAVKLLSEQAAAEVERYGAKVLRGEA